MGESIEELDSKLAVSGEELQRIKHYKVKCREPTVRICIFCTLVNNFFFVIKNKQ